MTSKIRQASETHTLTLSGNRNGRLKYESIGNIIIVSGFVQLTSSLSNGTVIATNVPAPYSQLANIPTTNSSTGVTGNAFADENGNLCVSGTWAAGFHRINGVYARA